MNKSKITDCNIITKENLKEFNDKANKFKTKKNIGELKELDRTELEKLESEIKETSKNYKKYVSESITVLNNCREKVNKLIDKHNIINGILDKTDGKINKLNVEINGTNITCKFVEDKKKYFSNQENDINKKISNLIADLNEKFKQKKCLVSLLQQLKYDVTGLEFKEVSNLEEITDDYVKSLPDLNRNLNLAYTIVNGNLDNISKEHKCKEFKFFTPYQIDNYFENFKANFTNFLSQGFSFNNDFKSIDSKLGQLKKRINVFISWYKKYKDFELEGVKFDDNTEIQNQVKGLEEIVKKIEERDYLHLDSYNTLYQQYKNTYKCFDGILEKLSENFKFKYVYNFNWSTSEYSDELFENKIENVRNKKYLYFFKIDAKDRFFFDKKDNKFFFSLHYNGKNLVFRSHYIDKEGKVETGSSYYSKNTFTTIPKLEDILNVEFEFSSIKYIVKLKDFLRVLNIRLEWESIMFKSKNYNGVKILLNSEGNFCEKYGYEIIDITNSYKFYKRGNKDNMFFKCIDLNDPNRKALELEKNYQKVINNEQLELNIDPSDVFVKDLSTYDTKGLDFDKIYNDITVKLEIKD